ncbi:MAG TPA: DUF2516 family protein [Cellulomonas sp.]
MSASVVRAASIVAGAASAQQILFLVVYLAIFLLCLWALVDCVLRPSRAFPSAGKRTKPFWLTITVAAAVVAFLSLPLGVVPFPSFLAFVAAVGGIVYLVDVRPAVAPYSRRRGRGRGGAGPSRGGW